MKLSIFDDTPKGVTIHHVDEGVDTGDIIFQKKVEFTQDEDDLSKTYFRLVSEIQELFIEKWDVILAGNYTPKPQDAGSSHIVDDFKFELPNGWDTKTEYVVRMGKARL